MTGAESSDDIIDSELFSIITGAAEGLTPPVSASIVLAAIKNAIRDHAETTQLPELTQQLAHNRLYQVIGALSLDQALKSQTLELWQQEVELEITKTDKLPRKTKKAKIKNEKGKKLGPRELARLQALRERDRNSGI